MTPTTKTGRAADELRKHMLDVGIPVRYLTEALADAKREAAQQERERIRVAVADALDDGAPIPKSSLTVRELIAILAEPSEPRGMYRRSETGPGMPGEGYPGPFAPERDA